MFNKIDHIAYKVENILNTIAIMKSIGIDCIGLETYDEVGIKVAFLDVGNTNIELLEVTNENSPLAGLALGFHHIAFKTDSIFETYDSLLKNENFSVEGEIQKGSKGKSIFFFKAKENPDLIFEYVEDLKF